jgi:predicted phosphate transport protein (TIGR00153 family)
MFSRKKEKKVKQHIKEHLLIVSETVKSMVDTVDSYVNGKVEESRDRAFATHKLESEADSLRREIIATLYKGAFFPAIREDLINYIAKQDKIAGRAESCCDFIISQNPKVPKIFSERILQLARAAFETILPLEEAVENYFDDDEKVRIAIREVNTKEEEADTIEWHLTESIFQNKEISLAEKIHLRELIFHIAHVSDVIEDAADMLDSVVIKRSI